MANVPGKNTMWNQPTKQRIELTDTIQQAIIKMAEGNPGALTAMIDLVKNNERVDPQSAFGPYSALLALDSYGIYGSDIYILWSDICDRDVVKTIACLRACQLGLFNSISLALAANNQDRRGRLFVPVDELLLKVKEQLREFDQPLKEPQPTK